MHNLNDIKAKTSKVMQLILAGFFDIRMKNVYGKFYMREVYEYCKREKKNNQEGKDQIKNILNKIETIGIEVVSADKNFDVSMLNHLILYGFRSDFDAIFSDGNIKTYHGLIRNIALARNTIMHDLAIEEDNLIITRVVMEAISASEALLSFLEKSNEWRCRGKSAYIAKMRKEIAEIREMLFSNQSTIMETQDKSEVVISPSTLFCEDESIFDELHLGLCAYRNAFRSGDQQRINRETAALQKLMQRLLEIYERNQHNDSSIGRRAYYIVKQYNEYVEKYSEYVKVLNRGYGEESNICAQYAEKAFTKLVNLVLKEQSDSIIFEDNLSDDIPDSQLSHDVDMNMVQSKRRNKMTLFFGFIGIAATLSASFGIWHGFRSISTTTPIPVASFSPAPTSSLTPASTLTATLSTTPTPVSSPTPTLFLTPSPTLTFAPTPTFTPSLASTPSVNPIVLKGFQQESGRYMYIYFGSYSQSYDKQPILWRVLSVQGNDVLLLSEYILSTRPFGSNNLWENCEIKEWLNQEFMHDAFTSEEQELIRNNSTLGSVFLPSSVELTNPDYGFIKNENKQDPHRSARGTAYAQNQNLYINYDNQCSSYYTRSKSSSGNVVMVRSTGSFGQAKTNRDDIGIRPMIWIQMPHSILEGDGSSSFPYRIR